MNTPVSGYGSLLTRPQSESSGDNSRGSEAAMPDTDNDESQDEDDTQDGSPTPGRSNRGCQQILTEGTFTSPSTLSVPNVR